MPIYLQLTADDISDLDRDFSKIVTLAGNVGIMIELHVAGIIIRLTGTETKDRLLRAVQRAQNRGEPFVDYEHEPST